MARPDLTCPSVCDIFIGSATESSDFREILYKNVSSECELLENRHCDSITLLGDVTEFLAAFFIFTEGKNYERNGQVGKG